jgi:phage gp46-like protein
MIRLEYDNLDQICDLPQVAGRIDTDEGFETAVLISLFTDAPAEDGDYLPNPELKGGWWGDSYPDIEGDKMGSRLWIVTKGKLTADANRKAEKYAERALQWMIDDGVAQTVQASSTFLVDGGKKIGITLGVQIQKPEEVAPRWARLWELRFAV